MTNPNVPQGPNNDDTRAIPYIQTPDSYVIPGPPPEGPYVHHVPPVPQNSNRTRNIVLIVIAVVVLLCCSGLAIAALTSDSGKKGLEDGLNEQGGKAVAEQTTTPSSGTTPTPPKSEPVKEEISTYNMKIPSSLDVTNTSGTLRVTVSKVQSKTSCGNGLRAKGKYLIFSVKTQVLSGTGDVNPLYFTFVDSKGETQNAFSGLFADCGSQLGSGNNLRKGSVRSGVVVFDLKNTKGELLYDTMLAQPGSWKVG
jgi:hypothetical protein